MTRTFNNIYVARNSATWFRFKQLYTGRFQTSEEARDIYKIVIKLLYYFEAFEAPSETFSALFETSLKQKNGSSGPLDPSPLPSDRGEGSTSLDKHTLQGLGYRLNPNII